MKKLLSIFIAIIPFVVNAQDSSVVTKNFSFTDGIYLSFEEFQTNMPSFLMEDIHMQSFTNPQTFLTQVDSMYHLETKRMVDPEEIWAICKDGIPFIKLPENEIYRQLPTFAALKLRGKICYYTYPDYRIKIVPIKAYNPLTGYPFLEGEVERDEKIVVEKILHFETGEVVDFNVENLLKWIQEDRHLVETIERTPREEVKEKLFRLLLIYVDRHETRIKQINN